MALIARQEGAWRKGLPIEPGIYWMRFVGFFNEKLAQTVMVPDKRLGEDAVLFTLGNRIYRPLPANAEFYGPIFPPE